VIRSEHDAPIKMVPLHVLVLVLLHAAMATAMVAIVTLSMMSTGWWHVKRVIPSAW
jgi:hypothetical protein